MEKSFLCSQGAVLKKRPLIVGTLTKQASINKQLSTAKSAGVDLIELRLDSFAEAKGPFQKVYEFGRGVIRDIKSQTKLPILLTFRSADEQGGASSGESIEDRRRAEILARLLPSVDMVDVEIRHRDFSRRMTVVAHIHGVDVIHSAHDFKSPGNLRELARLSKSSMALKGDVFKVAVTPQTNDDLETFLAWGLELKNPCKVLIGMGSVGAISRIVAFSFGSILTYGHLGQSAAPGQLAVRDLVKSIRNVYGAR